MNISFFCPAYLDEKNIGDVVRSAAKVLESVSNSYEIIIIDDKSPDNTGKVADELAKELKNVRVIHHIKNLGCGASIKTGFEEARNDIIIYTDGDNQYDMNDIPKLLSFITDYDIVVGFRKNRADSNYRKIQSKIYNFLINHLFGVNFIDINCSLKVFRREIIKQIKIESKSGFIDAEIMIKSLKRGAKIKQVEVKHKRRMHGIAGGGSPKTIFKILIEMIKFHQKLKSIQ